MKIFSYLQHGTRIAMMYIPWIKVSKEEGGMKLGKPVVNLSDKFCKTALVGHSYAHLMPLMFANKPSNSME